MKRILYLFLILNSFILFGQDKSETENWIIQKYNEYERRMNSNMDFWIENDYLYYYFTLYDDPIKAKKNGVIFKIKIKDIKAIKTIKMKSDSEDTIGWTRLILYTSKSKIYSKSLPDENTYNSTDEDFLNIPLKTEFIDEGINIRFQKALIHLVKLNGGNAIVKKEAF